MTRSHPTLTWSHGCGMCMLNIVCVKGCVCVCKDNNNNSHLTTDPFFPILKAPVLAQQSRLVNRQSSQWTQRPLGKARWHAACAPPRGPSSTWTLLKMRTARLTSSTQRRSLASMSSASVLEGSTSLTVPSKSRWVMCNFNFDLYRVGGLSIHALLPQCLVESLVVQQKQNQKNWKSWW